MSTLTPQGTDPPPPPPPPTRRSSRKRKQPARYREMTTDEEDELIDAYNDLAIDPKPSSHKNTFIKDNTFTTTNTHVHSNPNQHNKANNKNNNKRKRARTRSNKNTTVKCTAINKDPSNIAHIEEASLFNKASPLGRLDLKLMIPSWINQLPQEELTQLLTLLPDADKLDENTLDPDFFANSNRILWDAVHQWENTLLSGGFSQNGVQPSLMKEDTQFKDENYERYWGERLERIKHRKQTKSGRGRGRARGRSGKRKRTVNK